MLKKVLIFSLFCVSVLNATLLTQKIQNFLGEEEYNKHYKLVELLFKNEDKFYNQNTFDNAKILQILKDNGLLQLKYETPQELIIDFKILASPIKSLKIFNSTLKSLGYYYYFTKNMRYDESGILYWTIKLKTEYAIDPLILIQELKNKEIFIKNIIRVDSTHWQYEFDTKNGKISQVINVDTNEKVSLGKPLSGYLLKIKEGDVLKVISKRLNRWYPYIIFYDKDLKVLKTIERKRVYRGIKTAIPQGTSYIKIDDIYNLINIKRGLSIIVQSYEGDS